VYDTGEKKIRPGYVVNPKDLLLVFGLGNESYEANFIQTVPESLNGILMAFFFSKLSYFATNTISGRKCFKICSFCGKFLILKDDFFYNDRQIS
jgi:hypothetical protein